MHSTMHLDLNIHPLKTVMVQKQLQRDVCTKETSDHVLRHAQDDYSLLLEPIFSKY